MGIRLDGGRFLGCTPVSTAALTWFISTPPILLSPSIASRKATRSTHLDTHEIVEHGTYLVSIWGYGYVVLDEALGFYLIVWAIGNLFFVVIWYGITQMVRSIKDYQDQRQRGFEAYVSKRIGTTFSYVAITGIIMLYTQGAFVRVPVGIAADKFERLALDGVSCSTHDDFMDALAVSGANASCTDELCGYATWEGLCLAVQYSPLVRAIGCFHHRNGRIVKLHPPHVFGRHRACAVG